MNKSSLSWLLLIVSLPTNSATVRMRIWRTLKSLGCAALRDGAYLLPYAESHSRELGTLIDEAVHEGGNGWLLTVIAQSAEEDQTFRGLFDRSVDYADLRNALAEARARLPAATPQDINRSLRKLKRDYEAIRAIDYFRNDASSQAEADWADFVNAAESLLSPGEPQAVDDTIAPRKLADYQGRTWATRRQLWVDRVACAWLIRRFIDRDARFLWLESPAACPPDALGFDFDGATFTHVGERVSFEVLLASFGLEQDRGLQRLGAMIHVLDLGKGFVPEASGFEAMLSGVCRRVADDDQLLAEMSPVLDALCAHFSADPVDSKAGRGVR
jgi:hypothetical protein